MLSLNSSVRETIIGQIYFFLDIVQSGGGGLLQAIPKFGGTFISFDVGTFFKVVGGRGFLIQIYYCLLLYLFRHV